MGDSVTQAAEQAIPVAYSATLVAADGVALPIVLAAWRLKIYPTRWWIGLLSISRHRQSAQRFQFIVGRPRRDHRLLDSDRCRE